MLQRLGKATQIDLTGRTALVTAPPTAWASRRPVGWRDALVAAVPAVDIVVSNVGIFASGDFFATDDTTWDLHWQVNVMAGVGLAHRYLPGMAERGWVRWCRLSGQEAKLSRT